MKAILQLAVFLLNLMHKGHFEDTIIGSTELAMMMMTYEYKLMIIRQRMARFENGSIHQHLHATMGTGFHTLLNVMWVYKKML